MARLPRSRGERLALSALVSVRLNDSVSKPILSVRADAGCCALNVYLVEYDVVRRPPPLIKNCKSILDLVNRTHNNEQML